MKMEKISDNQIRCTLSSLDLSIRHMELRELTYGSENARSLFREMIQQASQELDFHVEDMPIMVEAIPIHNDGVVLLITKVEDPEELDTRFSNFTPSGEEGEYDLLDYLELGKETKEGIDDIIDAFKSMQEGKEKSSKASSPYPDAPSDGEAKTDKDTDVDQLNMVRIFRFPTLNSVNEVAAILKDIYFGENTLYKDEKEGSYYLVLNKMPHTPLEFNRICNILSEYGFKIKNVYATESYYAEHYTTIIRSSALQILAEI